MPRIPRALLVGTVAGVTTVVSLTGCTQKKDAGSGDAIQVTAADAKCDTSVKSVPAGQVTLKIENKGSKATEV
ncbi:MULTISPECIES: cupredoxin domain-containing protein, partial [unclassified Streptomyces]|uniref:cupredoxin domain-containing protein n=1 Tax=unclassified Streptomyces TaxID=2593676 RepID=UPI00344096B1